MGETALHIAVKNSRLDATIYLLKHGASASARDGEDQLPIKFAETAEIRSALESDPSDLAGEKRLRV